MPNRPQGFAPRPNYLAGERIYILAATKKRTGQKQIPTLYISFVVCIYKYIFIDAGHLKRCSAVNQSGPLCVLRGGDAELTWCVSEPTAKFISVWTPGGAAFVKNWPRRNGIGRNVKLLNKSIWVIAWDCQLESGSNWIHLPIANRDYRVAAKNLSIFTWCPWDTARFVCILFVAWKFTKTLKLDKWMLSILS